MNYKDKILKDLEYDLEESINKKDLFVDSSITSKYIEYLGFKYISNLNDYYILTSNLSFENKINCIENNIVLLKNKTTKQICLGLKNLNNNLISLNSFEYEEIIILDQNIFDSIFSNILIASNTNHSKKNLKFYRNKIFIYNIPNKNCKAFDLLKSYYDEKIILVYISEFFSYINLNNGIMEIDVRENNFVSDLNKLVNLIKYSFNNEEKVVVINNTDNSQVKDLLSTFDFKFKVSYINKENFKKIYDSLPG